MSQQQADFQALQYQFTRHIRDPEHVPAPAGIEDRRMQIYRDLLYNNVEDFLASGFPVLRRIMDDGQWHTMVRDYFCHHQAKTPLFPKMTREFLQYLDCERQPREGDYPFLRELAHYEWLELAVAIDTREISLVGVDRDGDLLEGIPVLSPLAWPFAYQYPVHKISPEFLPKEPPRQPTYLVVFRDRKDEVGFLELNPVSARLLELLQREDKASGQELLGQVADEIQHPDPQVVLKGGAEILQSMHDRDIILGTQCS